MKKILILLSLSILLTSCFEQKEEKVILDKQDQKIIEEVLNIDNSGTEVKTEEQAIEEIKKEDKKEENIVNSEEKKEVKKETVKTETVETETKKEENDSVKENISDLNKAEEEADNILNELLNTED